MATEPDLPVNTDPLQQNRNYQASNGADGDRSEFKGTTISGKQQTSFANIKSPITDRMRNPLGDFSSYTYQLTLYMVSPAAYNAFVETGRTNINAIGTSQTISNRATNLNEGIFIVAQSGGINKTENRAPYLDLDYYIDDLKLTSNVSGQSTQSPTNVTEVSFKIIEPYGFSFLTQLKLASETLKKTSTGIAGYNELTNSLKQFFILGIRFIGYDSQGRIVDANKQLSGTGMDKTFSGSSMEKFYDIAINKLNFKLDGRATVYNISASVIPTLVGFGIRFGRVDKNAEIQAETVGDALKQLMTKLTTIQSNAQTEYNLIFVGDDIDKLFDSRFYSDADLNKLKSSMSVAKKTNQVTDAVGLAELPKLTVKQFKINNSTSVLQQIDDIISQSEYLVKALSVVYKSNLQARQDINEQKEIRQDEKQEVQWYHISADVQIKEFNTKRNDYSYKITYIIEPYKTPAVSAAYIPNTTPYYGPHKRYNYYFTGENSEIINYEQTLNNAFFNIIADTNLTPENYDRATQAGQISAVANKRQNQSKLGSVDMGNETINAYRTSLYDPNAFALAKITILGDPDYLNQDTTSSVSRVYNQFYGPGYTINANGGQVFIEINFKEAIDYDNKGKTGLLDINDKILFWKYPKDIADKIQGIVYQVQKVTHTFSKGKFTQELECNMPAFAIAPQESQNQRENQTAAEANRLLRSGTTSTSQVLSPPLNPAKPATTQTTTAGVAQRTVPIKPRQQQPFSDARLSGSVSGGNPNPVRDDDGGGTPPSPFQVGA